LDNLQTKEALIFQGFFIVFISLILVRPPGFEPGTFGSGGQNRAGLHLSFTVTYEKILVLF